VGGARWLPAAVLLIVVLLRFTHPPIWVTGVGLFGVATVVFGIVYWLQWRKRWLGRGPARS
jgi:hypothetical protein